MPARALLLTLALALALPTAPAAFADGDPASDILPSQDAYYPYTPPVSRPLVTALNGLLTKVRTAGFPMKVALIESQGDLGSYATLFNSPQRYADLLASELPTQPDKRVTDAFHLLVVMPGGFGGEHLGDGVNRALDPISIDVAAGSDGLARAAIEAVARLASVNGHQTPVPPEAAAPGASSGGGGGSGVAIAIGAVALVLVAAAFGLARRRRGSGPDPA
jgi:MYXO-CTERM domain-containing protein